MGVSGSGKTTIGQLLAEQLKLPFYDADDFHPKENIQKMKSGHALNDEDRQPWLERLSDLAQKEIQNKGAVITCSALKEKYRIVLNQTIEKQVHWIFLDGSFETILERVNNRPGHFMPPELLQSQFDALERPKNAITFSILAPPYQIVEKIIKQTAMQLSEFGLIGLGVMGKSLSLNLAENGFHLSLFNRHETGVEENIAKDFIASDPFLKSAKGFDNINEFVASLEAPRKIFLMIKAGPVTDKVIDLMIPILEKGDIIIDGGNSHYKDTKRRIDHLAKHQIHFVGSGVSGGEEGARKGPSIMPGGPKETYPLISKYLEAIAAKDKSGNACCTYIGSEGAGHFIKMVHNGVEYAEMQLIAETYGLLRYGAGHAPDQIADIFESWMSQGLSSYLLEISINIMRKKENDEWLIDQILDKAGNKGTGSWTTIAAAELGIPVTMITAALFARYTSSFKNERVANSTVYNFEKNERSSINIDELRDAYQIARVINHHQGFHLMQAASDDANWGLNFSEIARIWTNGCIIRSTLMEALIDILKKDTNLLLNEAIVPQVKTLKPSLSAIVSQCVLGEIAAPCLSEAIHFLHGYATANSSANLIQAQRDYFGAHTYQRIDDDSGAFYHTNWEE